MSSIDHLHIEAEMLQVEDHSELQSAEYLAKCLQPTNVCHNITTRGPPLRWMKPTLYTRHRTTVELRMTDDNLKDTLKSIHTAAVNRRRIEYSMISPPSINNNEANFPRRQRTSLSQLRSSHCKLSRQLKKRIGKDATDCCLDCGASPQDELSNPEDAMGEFSYLGARKLE